MNHETRFGIAHPTMARLAHEAEIGAAGAVTGAVAGAVAGPPGIAAGAVIGALLGTVAGVALARGEAKEAKHERELDDAIGLNGDGLGAPGLSHPPPKIGAFSMAATGRRGAERNRIEAPASGPIPGVA